MNFKRTILPWLVCAIAAIFYCYSYFLRISPSVMMAELMQNLHINATEFGLLTAFFYYAYDPMQLPVGIITDRFGARAVLFSASLLTVAGLFVFISSDQFYLAAAGRFLIGMGASFSYLTVLKLGTLWLPPNRFAIVAGSTTSFGMIAAALSDEYLSHFVQTLGYKQALYSALFAGVMLSVVIVLVVRNRPDPDYALPDVSTHDARLTFADLWLSLKMIIRKPQMWLIGIIGLLLYLPASVFLDVWGIPYLEIVYNLSPEDAATAVGMVFLGWIISSPLIGALSDFIKRRKLPLLLCSVGALITVMIVFYFPTMLSQQMLFAILFMFGVFCGSHPLCFSMSKESNPKYVTGTAIALTNTLIMAGGMIFQPLVGRLLEFHAIGIRAHGVPIYNASDYMFALALLPVAIFIAFVMCFFLEETYFQNDPKSKSKLAKELGDDDALTATFHPATT